MSGGRFQFRKVITVILLCFVVIVFVKIDVRSSSLSQVRDVLLNHPSTLVLSNDAIEIDLEQNEIVFDGTKFANDTPASYFLAPNIVHYIRWNKTEYSFVDYICFRSAYVNHKPAYFYIHTNRNFTGKWWNKIQEEADWSRRIKIFWLEPPTEIWGQKLSTGWQLPHGSDIERIRLLMKHGGIWFDNDVYVVQNLDYYRRFEMALAWDENQFLGTQVLVANKNARFLPMWLDTYKVYYSDRWYYNAGERPTVEVLYKTPSLVHRVKLKFGAHMLVHNLYKTYWPEWRDQICMHLLFNHRSYLDKENFEKYGGFNETTIREYNNTFGYMARELLLPEVYPVKD